MCVRERERERRGSLCSSQPSFYRLELEQCFPPVVAVISLLIVMAVFSTLIDWLMFLCSSSKYAVYGMTEALGEELKKLGKPGVKTTVVCPVFVNTGLCMFPKGG